MIYGQVRGLQSGRSSATPRWLSKRRRNLFMSAVGLLAVAVLLLTGCTSRVADRGNTTSVPSVSSQKGPLPSSGGPADPPAVSTDQSRSPSSSALVSSQNATGSTTVAQEVVDRRGAPLMTTQRVAVLSIDPAKVTDAVAVSRQIARQLLPIDSSLTAAAISSLIGAKHESFNLITLRQNIYSNQIQVLSQIPAVKISLQTRLLTTDVQTRSPVFAQLASFLESDPALARKAKIVTTLDVHLQAAATAALSRTANPAVLVAIQASTGDMLAVAQNDAADRLGSISLNGLYPPGSTFKSVTVAQALSSGEVGADTQLPCPGKTVIDGRTIPNDDQFNLGEVSLLTAFAHSCNTTMAALGAKTAPDALHNMALRLGLGADYIIPGITTVTGSVPVAETSAQRVEESIGQWQVVASPFGMALTGATVLAGSTPVPKLIQGQPTTVNTVVSPPSLRVMASLRDMFAATVHEGTATALAELPAVGGKTGTAQFGDGVHAHGWFVGTQKDMAFSVLEVGGETSKGAVSIAKSFLTNGAAYVP